LRQTAADALFAGCHHHCVCRFLPRAAEFENESTLLWAGLSVLISATTFFYFRWGILGIVLGQAGLLLGIALFRM
jgi:hypothetical protein